MFINQKILLLLKNRTKRISLWLITFLQSEKQSKESLALIYVIRWECGQTLARVRVSQT